MATYADIDDVALYFEGLTGEVSTDLEEKVERLLAQAENTIHLEFERGGKNLAAAADASPRLLEALVQVESEMVSSVLKNPNSYLSESASVGGVSESHTIDLKTASGLLRFTPEQRTLLGLPARGRGGKAFTVPASKPRVVALDAERWC